MYAKPTENTFSYISKFHHTKYNGNSSQWHLSKKKKKDALGYLLKNHLAPCICLKCCKSLTMYVFAYKLALEIQKRMQKDALRSSNAATSQCWFVSELL